MTLNEAPRTTHLNFVEIGVQRGTDFGIFTKRFFTGTDLSKFIIIRCEEKYRNINNFKFENAAADGKE